MTRQTHVQIGTAVAKEHEQWWEIIQPGHREDFEQLMDMLTQVTVDKVPLKKAAMSFNAKVYEK